MPLTEGKPLCCNTESLLVRGSWDLPKQQGEKKVSVRSRRSLNNWGSSVVAFRERGRETIYSLQKVMQ